MIRGKRSPFDHVKSAAKAAMEVVGVPADAAVATVRNVAQAVGVIPMNLADAEAAAIVHQGALVTAQTRREDAEQALQAAHDRNAEDGEVKSLEAVLADAKVEEARAQARYRGAETRLAAAEKAEKSKANDAIRARVNTVIEVNPPIAARIDENIRTLAADLAALRSHDDTIREAVAAGVISADCLIAIRDTRRLAELSLAKAGVINGAWFGDPADRPSCSDVVAGDCALLRASMERSV